MKRWRERNLEEGDSLILYSLSRECEIPQCRAGEVSKFRQSSHLKLHPKASILQWVQKAGIRSQFDFQSNFENGEPSCLHSLYFRRRPSFEHYGRVHSSGSPKMESHDSKSKNERVFISFLLNNDNFEIRWPAWEIAVVGSRSNRTLEKLEPNWSTLLVEAIFPSSGRGYIDTTNGNGNEHRMKA